MDNQSQTIPVSPTLIDVSSTPADPTSKWLIIFFLLFFPPVAFFLIWRDKYYHTWFFYLLLLFGILSLFSTMTMLLFVVPQLSQLYSSLNVSAPLPIAYFSLCFSALLSVVSIIIAINIRKRIHRDGKISDRIAFLAFALLFSPSIFSFISIFTVITPIYNLIGSIQ